jgi:glycosyltransferase involved in cell wall biosynthesis
LSRSVTVVIPSHGGAPAVAALLGALDSQVAGRDPLPVIVVDDASPEPLAEALGGDRFEALDLRVVRRSANGGPGAARNRGLAEVETPWTAFIDADELPAADWLGRLESLIAAPDAPDVIAGRVVVPTSFGPFEHATDAAADAEQYVAGNVVFRTEQLRSAGGFDERFYDPRRRLHFREDAELHFRFAAAGRSAGDDPELVVEHPPLPPALWGPVRLARRYYFDPLLAREHPERFRALARGRRAGPIPLRRARHDAAFVHAVGAVVLVAGAAARSPRAAKAGGAILLAGVVLAAGIVVTWVQRGFGQLSEERLGVFAAALIIIGLQVFFSSFLLSILGLRRRG